MAHDATTRTTQRPPLASSTGLNSRLILVQRRCTCIDITLAYPAVMQRLILASQKEMIFTIIHARDLDPHDFVWNEVPSSFSKSLTVSELFHPKRDFYFRFDYKNGYEFALFAPGETSTVGSRHTGSWQLQFQCFHKWLGFVRRELFAVDPWSSAVGPLTSTTSLLSLPLPPEPIDSARQDVIRVALDEFRREAASHLSISEQTLSELNSKVDYLIDASRRQSSQDWLMLALGVFLQFLLSAPEIQSQATAFWAFVRAALLRFVTSFKGPLPPLSPEP